MNRTERFRARDVVTAAAMLGVRNKDQIHYTENAPARWEGIANGLIAAEGQFPHYADCSAFVTWCLWQALRFGPDAVNGEDWKAGYTGTMMNHGKVVDPRYAVRGDAVMYGNPVYHTAIVVGRNNGQLMVVSHGEETGPYLIPYNAWGVNCIRRYISSESFSFDDELSHKPPVDRPKPGPGKPSSDSDDHPGKIYQGEPVPNLIRKGSGQCLGLISGPNHVHGGVNAEEQHIVKMLQQRLIACGFVPGVTNVHADWADGRFEEPTKRAVRRFQENKMPNTQFWGQVWYDDWNRLFNL